MTVGDRQVEGVTVIAQNAEEYTYFGRRPIRLSPDVALDDGSARPGGAQAGHDPRAAHGGLARVLGPRGGTLARHRQVESFPAPREAEVVATDGGTFPVQVDGDYIGAVGPGAVDDGADGRSRSWRSRRVPRRGSSRPRARRKRSSCPLTVPEAACSSPSTSVASKSVPARCRISSI